MGVENGMFWSEIGSGFTWHTPTENSEEYPPPPGFKMSALVSLYGGQIVPYELC